MATFVNFKEQKFQENINKLNQVWIPAVRQIIDEYERLALPRLTLEELVKLLSDPKNLVIDKVMAGNTYDFSGFPFDKKKIRELIEIPKGYDRLEKIVEGLGTMFSRPAPYLKPDKPADLTAFFDLTEADEISIKESKVVEIKKKNSVYLESPEAETLYEAGQAFIEIINNKNLENIIAKRYPTKDFINRFFSELFIPAFESEPIKLNLELLKGYDVIFKG